MPVDLQEIRAVGQLLARAHPPPILYRYRGANEHAIEELRQRKIYAASPDSLNDPFEYHAPIRIDSEKIKKSFLAEYAPRMGLSPAEAQRQSASFNSSLIERELRRGIRKIRDSSGVICLSEVPDSIRMWSYYAQCHEGICVGFDSRFGPFMTAMQVQYENPNGPLDVMEALRDDSSLLAAHISLRKAAEWKFEKEYRIPIGPMLDEQRLVPYNENAIVEVRFGARINERFREKVMEAVRTLAKCPELIQMRCDHDRFVLVEEPIAT